MPTRCFSIVGLKIFTSLSRYRSQCSNTQGWRGHTRTSKTHIQRGHTSSAKL